MSRTETQTCQFPIELVERLVLSLTNNGDLVVDPYMGSGSTACAAVLHGRRAAGADLSKEYLAIASDRVAQAKAGRLRRRPFGKEVYVPGPNDKITKRPLHFGESMNGRERPAFSELLF